MDEHDGQVLIDTIQRLMKKPAAAEEPAKKRVLGRNDVPSEPRASAAGLSNDEEAQYIRFKNRLLEDMRVDPILLHLISQQPEMVVDVERRLVSLEGSTLRGRVARYMAQGWFGQTRVVSACRKELARTGSDPSGNGNLKTCLDEFVRDGFLVRDGDGYQLAPGVKVTERELQAI